MCLIMFVVVVTDCDVLLCVVLYVCVCVLLFVLVFSMGFMK